uniref:Uncharacterized protein n=1 Tax=Arundo donax TaxID=35708 RepID=A0A0A9FIX5_ARUDO
MTLSYLLNILSMALNNAL